MTKPSSHPSLHGASDINDDLLQQIEPIYMDSFPPEERVPFEDLVEAIRQGRTSLFTIRKHAQVCGFAMTEPLASPGINYLMYLAIDRSWRGKGIGTRLVRFIRDEMHRTRGDTALIWEVESPDEGTEVQRRESARRIAFYQRNGATLIEQVGDYRVPNLAREGHLPMKLMWIGVGDALPPDRETTSRYVREILQGSYGLERGDPLLRHVLASITQPP